MNALAELDTAREAAKNVGDRDEYLRLSSLRPKLVAAEKAATSTRLSAKAAELKASSSGVAIDSNIDAHGNWVWDDE